ncbi:MAG TPA: hypothetical protein VFW38_00335 [Solirubrobacteraceae bacterium]|nr:hypothetical protein [Solirubrobacteraceae bacterium]
MKTTVVPAPSLANCDRLDAWYFISPGAIASRLLTATKAAGLQTRRLGGPGGLAEVWMPNRLTQVTAVPGEASRPYLKPHDLFRYLTNPADRLSVTRTRDIEAYEVRRGMILQTRSGRNLGPGVLVDEYLADFVVSDDLIRIWVDDSRMRFYLAAYLLSSTGRALLRRDKSGSVIDHLSVSHVAAQEIPLLSSDVFDEISETMAEAFLLVEEARLELTEQLRGYEAQLPSPSCSAPGPTGWTVNNTQLLGRLDAASYDPWIAQIRDEMLAAGGAPVGDHAEVLKPPGRYKTNYVDAAYGLPFLSGTQILQLEVVNQRYMSPKAFVDADSYKLEPGWSVYQADGRAQESLGFPAMVLGDRRGWAASGHVGRLVPRDGTNAGWLWLAVSTWQVQVQLKALASGSVVDSTFPSDMQSVVLPPAGDVDGDAVTAAWSKFSEARHRKRVALQILDDELAALSGVAADVVGP